MRKGRAERVEQEGLPFLEDKVISTWLLNTAADCEKDLAKRWENIELFWQLLSSAERFDADLRAEEAIEGKQNPLLENKATLESTRTELESKLAEAEAIAARNCRISSPSLGTAGIYAFSELGRPSSHQFVG